MNPKKIGKALVCRLLERQVKQLRQKNDFRIVAVAGSVGKTSTKLAIAKTLEKSRKVIYQDGNYNDRLTVPLVLFGQAEPNILNPFAWLKILIQNANVLRRPYPYDIAVLELGVDGPGQMQDFAYLQPELAVVTAVAPEHMEYFGDLAAVAREELAVMDFSKEALLNVEDIAPEYLPKKPYISYGKNGEYSITSREAHGLGGQHISVHLPDVQTLEADTPFLGQQGATILLAAAAVARKLGLTLDETKAGIEQVQPFAGRMQILGGVNGASLIDDTYNASPVAVKAALDVLYSLDAPQRVAILGSMNEMGEGSQEMHRDVGEYCDPGKLDLVVTIGGQANEFLAPAASEKGCRVEQFLNPYEAGEYVKGQLEEGAIVLAKGSQNGVFAEEALKQLLANPDDAAKLVRQSPAWLRVKAKQFK
ncbi:MAG TPA: UDP-N-acetylmuramoyl-tripeptide--D-alanyl-D-alanine ligase [Candidatus Saccharimonadales bacterium]|nr:UDP-N-acetylmuramoyl-tripeptide--D-alanyl-D-alanine ligase [Candidatus Saccharimonadales bacterium]